jgi:excisionase family DNA binding protein
MDNTLLTAKQAQELLKVDRTTIYRMLKDGRLNGVKVGHQWRFFTSEVNDLLAGAKQIIGNDSPVSINALPLHCMQPVQNVFAEIAQVGAVTTNLQGQALTKISNSCDFCKLILGSENGRQACIESWKNLANQKENSPEFTSCHAGLQYTRTRIEVRGELLAVLIAGQFYLQPPDPEEEKQRLQTLAEKYHVQVAHTFEDISSERADLMSRLKKIAVMSDFG